MHLQLYKTSFKVDLHYTNFAQNYRMQPATT